MSLHPANVLFLDAGPSTSGLIRTSWRPSLRSGYTMQQALGQRSAANTSAMPYEVCDCRVTRSLARSPLLQNTLVYLNHRLESPHA